MEQETFFLLDLVIVLIVANLGGFVARKIKQPSILGQIIAGVIIGPAVLNMVGSTSFIADIAEIGVILLMFIAGLETDLDDLKASGKASSLIAIGGVIAPVIMTIGMMNWLRPESAFGEQIFIGVILTATSVSISVQVLRELKQIRTKVGVGILGAAIIDDVLGIILVALVVGLVSPENSTNIFLILLQITGFFVFTALIGMIFVKLMKKYHSFLSSGNKILSLALIFCFVLSVIAEELGVSAVIGAYFTGVVFSSTHYRNRVSTEVQRVAYSLFIPVFFVNIGLLVNFDGLKDSLVLSIGLIVVAFLSKIVGCWIGAKLSHFTARESLQVAIGMIPRVEVALIVANLGVKLGIVSPDVFTASILVVLTSTLFTPILLKAAFKKETVTE